jgi:hypothetical protein
MVYISLDEILVSVSSIKIMYKIYLDDLRTPVDPEWIVVRSYDEFVAKVKEIGLENIEIVTLDHDLGDTAVKEYFNNTAKNYTLNYENIEEKTGYDAAKWMVDHFYDKNPDYNRKGIFPFPQVYSHSANPIGVGNILGYINNFLKNERQPQTCVRWKPEHTV